MKKSMQCI